MRPLLLTTLLLASPAVSSGWIFQKSVDPMDDRVTLTVSQKSADGHSSLRCACTSDGKLFLFLVMPVHTGGEFTLASLRLDSGEVTSYSLMELSHKALVDSMGGAKKGVNLVIMERGVSRTLTGASDPDALQTDTRDLLREMGNASTLTYDLPLLKSPAAGSQGRFNLVGFSKAFAPLAKACPSPE